MYGLVFFVCLALCLAPGAWAQKTVPPATALREARTLYYTPQDKGLEGFQCEVSFDWKQFIEKATNAAVDDNNERLAYLRGIKLTVTDDLNGEGELHWSAPAAAPQSSEDSIAQIRGGIEQMWTGFFQSWNGLYGADVITMVDSTTTVDRTENGYHAFSREGGKLAEETFGGDFTLLSLHVSTPEADTVLTPKFQNTPQGRLVKGWSSTVKQPPTAPGMTLNMTVQYATVNGFQIPSEVLMDVVGMASFDFHLSGCTVKMKPATTTPPAGTSH